MRITCFVNTRESFQKGENPILLVFPYVAYFKAKMCLRISSLLTMQMRWYYCNTVFKNHSKSSILFEFLKCNTNKRFFGDFQTLCAMFRIFYHVKNFIGRTKFPMKTKLFDFFTAGISPLCNCHLAKLREYLRVLMFFYGDDVSVMEKF